MRLLPRPKLAVPTGLEIERLLPEGSQRGRPPERAVPGGVPLVMVGGAPYAPELARRVRELADADERVVLTGPVYGDGYRELLFNALAYIHATEVGGTHPALVEAMGAGRVVFYLDNPPNREVARGAGVEFRFTGPDGLDRALTAFLAEPGRFFGHGEAARERVLAAYRWDDVARAYERLLEGLCCANRRA